ncbi:MAG TPA: DUF1707 and FHA domain-containing protein [Streptosporangiaceae bacterium]|nr:DUF1707 and FHA domain-containing protein [Streptosporangiaceae bacterium]
MRASGGRDLDGWPAVRACDADRDRVIAELRDRFADGSLAQESFLFRVDAALRARWHGDLAQVVADLPAPRPSLARAVRDRLARAGYLARRRLTRPRPSPAPAALILPSGTRASFTIGRDAACDLVLADMTVSRWHAGLRREGSGWLLADTGSTNGTRLNGWRVTEPVPLRAGDRVMFGSLTMVVTEHTRPASGTVTPVTP